MKRLIGDKPQQVLICLKIYEPMTPDVHDAVKQMGSCPSVAIKKNISGS